MKFRPLGDRVVVRRTDAETKTAGGIIIPDSAKEKPMEGEVVAVGAGARADDGSLLLWSLKLATVFCSASGMAQKLRSTAKTC